MNIFYLGNTSKEGLEKKMQMIATAGTLSRAEGTVSQVYESRNDFEKNVKLAKKVVGYGHKTIAEHDYLVLGLENVTVLMEQILIGYRLTSFTIKSRRNVDFRNAGFYVPEFKDENNQTVANNIELQDLYKKHMKKQFDEYGKLVDCGLPIEDCRYVLPYCFYSNIIFGCDANELLRVITDLLYGKNSHIAEAHELGERLAAILNEQAPYLTESLKNEVNKGYYEDKYKFVDKMVQNEKIDGDGELLPQVNMTNYTQNADWIVLCNILMERYQLSMEKAADLLHKLSYQDSEIKRKLMQALIHSKNQRELEQVMFSFEIPIELAVLTHLTRHRMHSLLVPDFYPLWNFDNYVIPESLKEDYQEKYEQIFADNKLMMEYFKKAGVRDEDLVYFYLSGNACNVYTTMDAKSLMWISRMRTCNKAQSAIRNIAKQMVSQVSNVAPLIGEGLGPYCKVEGICPEGKDSCKNRGVVIKKLDKKD